MEIKHFPSNVYCHFNSASQTINFFSLRLASITSIIARCLLPLSLFPESSSSIFEPEVKSSLSMFPVNSRGCTYSSIFEDHLFCLCMKIRHNLCREGRESSGPSCFRVGKPSTNSNKTFCRMIKSIFAWTVSSKTVIPIGFSTASDLSSVAPVTTLFVP